jgi:predicted RNA-binding Zn-ribbon protein involved in translation (DUF1610 family)
MTTVIITVVLLALAVGAFFLIVNSAIGKSCPQCGAEQMIVPVVPGFMAWCPQCGQIYRQEELIVAGQEGREQGVEDFAPPADDYQQQTYSASEEPSLPVIDPDDIITPEPAAGDANISEEQNINPGPPRF